MSIIVILYENQRPESKSITLIFESYHFYNSTNRTVITGSDEAIAFWGILNAALTKLIPMDLLLSQAASFSGSLKNKTLQRFFY